MAHYIFGQTLGEDITEVEDHCPLRQTHHRLHDVLYPDDGHVELITNRSDYFDGSLQLCIVETCHDLIEYQKPGLSGDGPGQFKEPLLVQVEISDGIMASVSQADERKRLTGKLESLFFISMCSRPAKESPESYILERSHGRKVAGSLLHHGDPHLTNAVRRVTGDILTGEPDRASGRHFETDDQLEQRALAGAVGADDGENLAIVGPQVHSVDRGQASKVFLDLIQLEKSHLAL
jgi:hypothetical protein